MKTEPAYLEIISIIDKAYTDYKTLHPVKVPQLVSDLLVFFCIVFTATTLVSILLLLSHAGTAGIVKPIFSIIFLLTLFTVLLYIIYVCSSGFRLSKKRGIGRHATKNRVINDIELLSFATNRIKEKKITKKQRNELLTAMEYRMSFEPVIGGFLINLSTLLISISFTLSQVLNVDLSQYIDETTEWYANLLLLMLFICGVLIKLFFVPQWARYIAVIKFSLRQPKLSIL